MCAARSRGFDSIAGRGGVFGGERIPVAAGGVLLARGHRGKHGVRVSYLAPNGNSQLNDFYPWQRLSATSLHPWADTPSVYAYAGAASFPNRTWNERHDRVDVVFSASTTPCAGTFWTNATLPAVPEAGYDTASVTLGLTFYSDVSGSVTGVRFYKGPHNTGTHVGDLWSSTGAKLAEVVLLGETASGWQRTRRM